MTRSTSDLVAGVDGCPGGWVVVTAGRRPGSPVTVRTTPDVGPVLADLATGRLAAVAIDIPIGLPDVGPRACDVEARVLLGPRRASVFPAPVRATLGSADHAEACVRSRAVSGRALSIQAFNLLGKIAEVDRLLPPALHHRFVESHPELAFIRLAAGAVPAAKRTVEGGRRRRALVAPLLAGADPVGLARSCPVPLVDLLDAAALVATARRLADGTAEVLGGDPDAEGRPMQIAW